MADQILKRYYFINPLYATALFLCPLKKKTGILLFQGAKKAKVTSGME